MAKKSTKAKKGKRGAPAKLVSLEKRATGPKGGQDKRSKATVTPGEDNPGVTAPDLPANAETTALARIGQLEADRTNLMAQVAWARAVAQEQQKTLEVERERAEKLAADLETQRARVEQLKALSLLDRLLGRHKRI